MRTRNTHVLLAVLALIGAAVIGSAFFASRWLKDEAQRRRADAERQAVQSLQAVEKAMERYAAEATEADDQFPLLHTGDRLEDIRRDAAGGTTAPATQPAPGGCMDAFICPSTTQPAPPGPKQPEP